MTAKCESPGGGRPGGARPGGARPGGARNCMIFRGDASGLVVDGQSLPIWIFMGSISLRFAALGTVRSSDRPCANLQFSPFLHRPLDENWKHRRVEIKSGWFLNSSSECAKLHSLPSLQRFELQYLQILVYFRESRICGVVITGQYCEAILSKLQSRDKRPGKGHVVRPLQKPSYAIMAL